MGVKVEIPSLYLCKFIMAMMVIMIHSSFLFPKTFYSFALTFCRVAVPMFLMISGFFSDSLFVKREVILWKILKICLISSLFWAAYYLIVNGGGYVANRINWTSFFDFLLLNTPFFGNHLWYLYAIFLVYLFFPIVKLLFNAKSVVLVGNWTININYLLIVSFILFYCSILYGISRSWLFTAIPFFLLGRYLYDNKDFFIIRVSNKFLWGMFVLCSGLLLFECKYSPFPKSDLYLFNLPLSVSLFLLFIKNPNWGINSVWAKIGNKDTLYIYIFHIVFVSLVKTIFVKSLSQDYLQYMFVVTIPLVVVMNVLFSRFLLFVESLLKKKK